MVTSSETRSLERHVEAPPPGLPSSQGDGSLPRGVVRSMVLAIPVLVLFFVGLTALAAEIARIGYVAAIAMGAGVGVLAGVFWGGWMGFLAFSRRESVDRDPGAAPPRVDAPRP